MNIFLNINKKFLVLILALIFIFFFYKVLTINFNFSKENQDSLLLDPKFDIVNPSFTINNDDEKIFVKANIGNFINKDLILLEKNVYFESEKFEIFSEKVTFNRKNQTAESKTASKFKSEGTEINSEGFTIKQKGDVIVFNGKTSLILNQ